MTVLDSWSLHHTDCPCAAPPRSLVSARSRYHVHGVTPGFCFGHGLSYTTWSYSALQATRGGASFVLTNTGGVAGAEVAQLYLTFPPSSTVGEPPRQLRGFRKVHLQPGQAKTVTLPFNPRDFSVWDVRRHAWVVVCGAFQVEVGASSCDVRAKSTVEVGGGESRAHTGSVRPTAP